jgi:hypothetical protein
MLIAQPLTAADLTRAQVRADKEFATYVYAHEFGSGVYDYDGRTLQVYGLPFSWSVTKSAERRPGLRVKLPVTLGFLDFQPTDVISTGLPDSVDSVSFVPGVELDFELRDEWHLLPYVQAGWSVARQDDVETRLVGAGVRAARRFVAGSVDVRYAGDAIYSGVRYRGEMPDDDFVRVRNGVEFSRGTGRFMGAHETQWGVFAVLDAYADPPAGPATGLDVPRVQLETGLVVGLRPRWYVWKIPMPQFGVSYRFAGDLSTLRLVLGTPF